MLVNFNYSQLQAVQQSPAPCGTLKTQLVGVDVWQSTQQTCSATLPICIPWNHDVTRDFTGSVCIPDAVPEQLCSTNNTYPPAVTTVLP